MSKDAEKGSCRIDYRERNVLTSAIYTEERLEKEADIEFVESSTDESSGFNPYDTASLFKK